MPLLHCADVRNHRTGRNQGRAIRRVAEQASGLLHGERDRIANAANFAALVWHALPTINWCGFYFFDGTELVVGPFQGKPACVRIALGTRRLRHGGVHARKRSWSMTWTHSRGISPAMRPRVRKSSCRW